ncbi:MAG: 50S ribosomal protein L30 [Polyangiaceae bacterium]|nr:50S ribosomal protein L30 [Polyangiaceae bacterium]
MSAAKNRLVVRQVRSLIGRPHPQHRVIAGLGLRGVGTTVVVDDTPSFRGMIKKVLHLVEVRQDSEEARP